MEDVNLDYLVISDTKLDECFHNAQFSLREFEIRTIRDRDKYVRGLIAEKDSLFLED